MTREAPRCHGHGSDPTHGTQHMDRLSEGRWRCPACGVEVEL